MKQLIHYSMFLSMLILRSEGIGACCIEGLITGYEGLVTCPECLEILGKEGNDE